MIWFKLHSTNVNTPSVKRITLDMKYFWIFIEISAVSIKPERQKLAEIDFLLRMAFIWHPNMH